MYINFQNFGFMASVKTKYFQGKNDFPDRIHQLPEILCIIDGSFELTVDGVTETAKQGDICVITPFRTHSWHTPSNCTIWQLVISMDFLSDFLSGENMYISGTSAVFTPSKALFDYVIERFPKPHGMQQNTDADSTKYWSIKSIVYAVFSEYMTKAKKKPVKLNNSAITKLLIYLNEHFKEDIDLDTVSEQLGYNKTYLSRCIHTIPNVNFRILLNSIRTEHAKNLLLTTDYNVLNIALDCGFANIRTMQRVFINFVGKTPHEYRLSHKNPQI